MEGMNPRREQVPSHPGASAWSAAAQLPGGAGTRAAVPVMPQFATGTQAHQHSVHSALATLSALQVGAHRISLERAGRDGAPAGTVLAQHPPAGSPLLPGTRVTLRIAGLGFTHALPVGMWDSGGETHVGTREILSGLDDPLEKLKHWFHEGAPLFSLSNDDPEACARWLELFGVDPAVWPRNLWYSLATLVAGMAQYSCSESGCAFVLQTLLGLPVQQFRREPAYAPIPAELCSGLGARASRLGVDMVMGDTMERPAALRIVLGPVPLAHYEWFAEQAEGQRLLAQVLAMVLPANTEYRLQWSVLDSTQPPQLGVQGGNSRLGINTHMGNAMNHVAKQAEVPAEDVRHMDTEEPDAPALPPEVASEQPA